MASPTRAPRGPGSVRRPQLADEVAAHLRGAIMSGELRPGDYVRLDETASDLGVSVTPVREALLTLRGEGMVDSVPPNRGYVVAPFGPGDVADVFWLQGRIAVELALRAAELADETDLDRLADLNRALAASVSSSGERSPDVERIAEAEFAFHRELNRIAGSPQAGLVPRQRGSQHPVPLLRRRYRMGGRARRRIPPPARGRDAQPRSRGGTHRDPAVVRRRRAATRAHLERAGFRSGG